MLKNIKRLTADNYANKERKWATILWCDSEKDMETLERVKAFPSAIWILHDKDTYTEDSENHKIGDSKKPHYHIVFYFENARYGKSICKQIGLEEYRLEVGHSLTGLLNYLIHMDDPEKYRYSIDDVQGSDVLKQKLKNLIDKFEKSEEMRVKEILAWINGQDKIVTMKSLLEYCLDQGKWSLFKTAQYSWRMILEEHNASLE